MNQTAKALLVLCCLMWRGASQAAPAIVVGKESVRPFAQAVLKPKSGSRVSGSVELSAIAEGLLVRASVAHLRPGPHGIHIHETGNCSAADGSSAGGHLNPAHVPHGAPHAAVHHLGDMGNLVADTNGNASLALIMRGMTAKEGEAFVGKAIVVEEKADDPVPAGGTGGTGGGPRLACGKIEAVPQSLLH